MPSTNSDSNALPFSAHADGPLPGQWKACMKEQRNKGAVLLPENDSSNILYLFDIGGYGWT